MPNESKWDQDAKFLHSSNEEMVEAYTSEEMKGMKIYTCNSCGGEIICEETKMSLFKIWPQNFS